MTQAFRKPSTKYQAASYELAKEQAEETAAEKEATQAELAAAQRRQRRSGKSSLIATSETGLSETLG